MTRSKKRSNNASKGTLWHSLIWWAGVLSAVLLTLCGLSTFVTPARFPLIGVFVLGFPFLLAAASVFIVLAATFRVRHWWVLLIGVLINAWAVRIYLPINLPQEDVEDGLTVLSFNVQNFIATKDDSIYGETICNYILESESDVVCLQEAPHHNKRFLQEVAPMLNRSFAYRDSVELPKSSYLNIYSRLPIIGREIVANGESNHCAAFTLLDGSDTIYVVNCHLRSMGLSPEEKAGFSGIVHDADTLSNSEKRHESKMLITKIAAASVKRAEQVDKLCEYLERQQGKRIILCGDFNDTPISYAHNRVSSYLKDCYAATATGFGRSFNANSMLVRIDHMFCSKHFKPHACRIDQSVLYSDHYPIRCNFERVH